MPARPDFKGRAGPMQVFLVSISTARRRLLKRAAAGAFGRHRVLLPALFSSVFHQGVRHVPRSVNRNLSDFSRNLERFFDDGLSGLFGESREPATAALRSPALDVSETEQAYTVKLDMPGVPKDAIKISIDGRRVTVDAEQRREEEQKDGERLLYRERSVSRFARSFALPQEISQSDSNASMDHGVLTLQLAKRQASGASQLTVN